MLADPTDTTNDALYLEAADRDDDSLLASLTEQEYATLGCLDRPLARRTFATISFADRGKVVKAASHISNMVRIEHLLADLEPAPFERLELRYHAERLRQAETRLGDYIGGYGSIPVTQDAILAVAADIDRRFKEYAS